MALRCKTGADSSGMTARGVVQVLRSEWSGLHDVRMKLGMWGWQIGVIRLI